MSPAAIAEPTPQVAPRILLIEDDPTDARAVERGLRGTEAPPELVHVTRVMDGVARAAEQSFDLALLDLSLPDCDGLSGVRALCEACPELPVVVLTGLDDERTAALAIRNGAQDYLIKGDIAPRALQRSIQHAIERNILRRELAQAQQQESELKDRFLSHVSHELRTPLTAILQFVTILQDGIAGPVTPQQAEYLAIVRRNTDQLRRMIATLMDVTRAHSGKLSFVLQRIDLVATVGAAVTALRGAAEKKQIDLHFAPSGDEFEVVADVERTVEVVSNLLENAIKFTPAGGRIEVVIEGESRHECCRVSVRDTGCGVAPEQLEAIFERLHQVGARSDTSRNGLGLGLHISREIVTRMGGRIWAENERRGGSRFSFTLPRFCLASLVRRVTFGGAGQEPVLAVITATVEMQRASARAKGLDGAVREVERLLGGSILASSDVVVPGALPTGSRHVVMALARAGAFGGEAIAQRVRGEVERSHLLARCGFEVRVESWTPDVEARAGEDPGAVSAALAKEIRARFKSTGGA
ncbi:MAG: ATP-binding protein [Planctomycetota bacterium]